MKKDKNSICFVIPGWVTNTTGGAEWQCYLISEELIKRKWAVEVITDIGKFPFMQPEYYNKKIKFHYLKRARLKILTLAKLFCIFLRTNSKFYYVRTDARLMLGACAIVSKLRGRKIMYALAHDTDAEYAQSKYKKHNNLLKEIILRIDNILIKMIIHNSIYNSDRIIAQTNKQQKILLEHTGLDSVIIRNSILADEKENFNKENIILWVGNMRSFKQPEVFIHLVQELDLKDWVFVMIGENSDQLEMINGIDKPELKVLGELPYEETINWFKRSRIIVNTSEAEGFSNTFLQAWIYRVIIISLKVDPDSLLKELDLGVFAGSYKNLKQILSSIETINYTNLLDNGSKYVRENHNLISNVDQLVEVITRN